MLCSGEMRSLYLSRTPYHPLLELTYPQVEYLVVTYNKDEEKVLLSLRQAQILEALAADKELAKEGCVPALQDGPVQKPKLVCTTPGTYQDDH